MDFNCLKVWVFFFLLARDCNQNLPNSSQQHFLGVKQEKAEQCGDTHLRGSRRCCCHSPLQWSQADTHTGSCPGCCGTERGFCRAWRDTHQYPLCIFPLKRGEAKGETPLKAMAKRLSASTAQHWRHSTFPIHVTFPARATLAGVAFRVRRFLADSRVLTRIRGARRNYYLAVHTWRAEWEKAEECAAWKNEQRGCNSQLSTQHWTALPRFEKSQQKEKESRALLMSSV